MGPLSGGVARRCRGAAGIAPRADHGNPSGPRWARARANHALAEALANGGDDSRALTHWLDSLEDALATRQIDLFIEANLGLGNLYVVHEDHENAFRFHSIAADFARLHDNPDLRAKAALHLAADLIKLDRLEIAVTVLLSAQAD